jgi:uncharacterized protein YcbX
MSAPTITSIHIYPIKSMGGISLTEAEVGMRGLQHDRRYMLISSSGRFLSQRQCPQMAHFHLDFNANMTGFLVRFHDDVLEIPLEIKINQNQVVEAKIWDDWVSVLVSEKTINDWFSERLNQPTRLVYLPNTSLRFSSKGEETMSLADGYPILIISEASLEKLNIQIANNTRDSKPMEMMRFRPNILLGNLNPHEEDTLGEFQLDEATLQVVKPCSRCVLTTLDPINLQRGEEPLRTLSTYRKFDNKIHFGANVICLKPGLIQVATRRTTT